MAASIILSLTRWAAAAKGDVLHFGQKTIVSSVEITNDSGQTLAVGLFTFFALNKEDLSSFV